MHSSLWLKMNQVRDQNIEGVWYHCPDWETWAELAWVGPSATWVFFPFLTSWVTENAWETECDWAQPVLLESSLYAWLWGYNGKKDQMPALRELQKSKWEVTWPLGNDSAMLKEPSDIPGNDELLGRRECVGSCVVFRLWIRGPGSVCQAQEHSHQSGKSNMGQCPEVGKKPWWCLEAPAGSGERWGWGKKQEPDHSRLVKQSRLDPEGSGEEAQGFKPESDMIR